MALELGDIHGVKWTLEFISNDGLIVVVKAIQRSREDEPIVHEETARSSAALSWRNLRKPSVDKSVARYMSTARTVESMPTGKLSETA